MMDYGLHVCILGPSSILCMPSPYLELKKRAYWCIELKSSVSGESIGT